MTFTRRRSIAQRRTFAATFARAIVHWFRAAHQSFAIVQFRANAQQTRIA